MKQAPDLYDIQKLHHAGQLDDAKRGYQAILRSNPRSIEALHGLSIICAQQDDLPQAQEYLQSAITISPQDPTLQLHLANIYKHQGLYAEAGEVLLKITQQYPGMVAAYNNLGTIYFAQQQWQEAESCFRQAIQKQEDYFDAYYNLGLTLTRQDKIDEAIEVYSVIIRLTPYHVAGRFQLGCLFLQKNMLEEALCCFATLERSHPEHFETQLNLANCFLRKGTLGHARTHYEKALALMPDDIQILFNLGVVHSLQGDIDGAIRYYQQAITLNPDFFAAHNNLGVAFLAKQHVPYALAQFKEAQRIQPDNQAIAYTVQMLSNDQRLHAAPVEYVKNLFDAYADHYEPHLLQALDYQVPTVLHKAISEVRELPAAQWDILDLGCGTGLCGIPFTATAKQLIGVDLSEKMLAIAAQKNIYHDLVRSDLVPFLGKRQNAFDLILAGDVLVYLGDLAPLFQALAAALRPQGLFAFNAEIGTGSDYHMTSSGRFTHSKAYLDRLIAANGLRTLSYQTAVTRLQNNQPLRAHVYVVTR